MNIRTTQKGFTIIEVVLVLAIAALIFLMIFVALPALQRGQANTARKNDISTIAAGVSSYRSNHRGSISALDTAAIQKYADSLSQIDSTSVTVASGAGSVTANEANLDTAKVFKTAKCNTSTNQAMGSTSTKSAAVVGVVQTGAATYESVCQDV